MQVEDEEWVTHALMEYERRQLISKVLSLDCKEAVAKGNNYACDLFRINLKAVLNSGDIITRPVIFKMLPRTEARRAFIKAVGAHVRESRMYTEVLPEVEKLRSEKDCTSERFSAICYGIHRGHDGFLLEDLSAFGFKLPDRRKGLDFAHAVIALKTLADFHALTRVLIDRGDIVVKDFSENFHRDHAGPPMEQFFQLILNGAISNIEKWGGEWVEHANTLKEKLKTHTQDVKESLEIDDKNFNTLLHGDFWLTNVLFKYNAEGAPIAIRLLDFQMSNYNTVGVDLRYFFNTSLSIETYSRRDELLTIYHEELKDALSRYGFTGNVPDIEQIYQGYNKVGFWGLTVGLIFRPTIMQPQEAIIEDMEGFAQEMSKNQTMELPPFDENIRQVLQVLLRCAKDEGLL